MMVQQSSEKSGITGGYGVVDPGRDQAAGYGGQLPDRGMHVAHTPEIIHKGRVRTLCAIQFADVLP